MSFEDILAECTENPYTYIHILAHGDTDANAENTSYGLVLQGTNGDVFKHPDREAIGRIIKYGGEQPKLYFNFHTEINAVWGRQDLQDKYANETVYPDTGKAGLLVRL